MFKLLILSLTFLAFGCAQNTAPTKTADLPDQKIKNNAEPSQLNLSDYFIDLDPEDRLSYSVVASNPTVLGSINVIGETLTMVFSDEVDGQSLIEITATDREGLAIKQSFQLVVTKAPTLKIWFVKHLSNLHIERVGKN